MIDHASSQHQNSGARSCCDVPPRVTARTFLFACGIAIVTVAVFAPSLKNGFVDWDEPGLILENPHIRRLGWDQVRWMFTSFHMGPYQPLPWLSLALDYQIWGFEPLGYHLTSLMWHAANGVLFFVLSRRILRLAVPNSVEQSSLLELCAAISAIVFALHPLRVESVVWAAQRRDVLSGFFVLATVWAYVNAARPGLPRSRYFGWMVCSQLMFFMSLLCKATGVCLPAVLSILDVYPLGRLSWSGKWIASHQSRGVWLEKISFWIMSFVGAIAAMYGQRGVGGMSALESFGPVHRLALASFGSAFYVRKTLLPVQLSPLYEIPTNFDPWQLPFILSAVASLAITAIALRWARHWPAVLAVWLSYLFLLTPVSGLAQTGGQLAADRYSYLPCLGFALLLGGTALRTVLSRTGTWPVRALVAGGLLLCLGLGFQTWRQSAIWRNTTTLWTHALTIDPKSSVAYNNAAKAPIRENRLPEAARLLEKALIYRPSNSDAHNNMGVVLRRMGQPYQAIDHYREAERLRPRWAEVQYNFALLLAEEPLLDQLGFSSIDEQWQAALERYRLALAIRPDDVKTLNDLGILHKKMGQIDEAVRFYTRALQIDPDYVNSQYNLAIALADQGSDAEASNEYLRALKLQPGHVGARTNLALLLERRGRYRESSKFLRDGLVHSPDQPVLLFHLSWLLATAPDPSVRNGLEALALAEQLQVVTGGQNPQALDALAAAYAEAGRFEDAIETGEQASRLAAPLGNQDLANQIDERLELYRSQQPYRSPAP
jgi:tetratricopeptide (TPR) repeat protein